MKWYYKFKLKRIQAEIEALKKIIDAPLLDNYNDHLRLRSLSVLAERLETRLAK